jgi:tyrosyl-tRNA synthetase
LDEATIVRKAMEGLTKNGIEKWAADHAINQAKDAISRSISEKVKSLLSDGSIETKAQSSLIEAFKTQTEKYMTPKNLQSKFEEKEWEGLFEKVVSPILTDFIENALDDWLSIGITVGSGKKKKTVRVAGVDSYTFRKR